MEYRFSGLHKPSGLGGHTKEGSSQRVDIDQLRLSNHQAHHLPDPGLYSASLGVIDIAPAPASQEEVDMNQQRQRPFKGVFIVVVVA